MKTSILLFVSLISLPLLTFSQNKVAISGTVIESNSSQALEFATVVLTSPMDSSIVAGGITDVDGHFRLEAPVGTYNLRSEFIGFKPNIIENIKLEEDTQLDPIRLEQDSELMDAVEVTAEKSTIEFKLDKRVFNVGKDITSKGGTANEVLTNVPSVSVSAAGAVSLRGNSGVQILINGKPSVLTENGGLESIPAENIEKVEVITNPSSKYNAEGTAGIINIVLKKNNRSGFSSSLNLSAGIPDDQSLNFNVNYKKDGKFNIFSNFRYSYREFLGYGSSKRIDFNDNSITSVLNQKTDNNRTRSIANIYVGGDYYINDYNTLTLSYYYRNNLSKNYVDYTYSLLDSDMALDSVSSASEFYKEPQIANQIELNHVKDFKKEGQRLTFNLQYEFWNDDENEYIDQQELFPTFIDLGTLRSRDVESSKDFFFKSDLSLPIKDQKTIEFGVQAEIKEINSDYAVWQNEIAVDSLVNFLKYQENIYGAFTQFGNKKNKLQYLIGVRAEYADTRSKDQKNLFPTSKKYINLFPTAHFTYSLSELSNVQLSYSRRIRRPGFWQINPFGGISDTRNIRIGNPDLNPMYTHSYELAWLRNWDKLTLNPSIYAQQTSNRFQTSVLRNAEGVLISQQINAGTEEIIGLELVTSYSPKKWLRLSHEVNFYSFKQEGIYNVSGQSWQTRLNSTMKFSKFSAQFSVNYRAPRVSGPFDIKGQYWADAGISTDLLKDKLTFAINARNLFDSRNNAEELLGAGYTVDREVVWSGRRVMATLTYRFNRTKNDRDRLPG